MALSIGLSKRPHTPDTATMFRDAMDRQREHQGRLHTLTSDIWSERHDFDFLATIYDADFEKPDSDLFNYAANLASLNIVSRVEQVKLEGFATVTGAMGAAKVIMNHRKDIGSLPWIHVGWIFEGLRRRKSVCNGCLSSSARAKLS